MIGYFWQELGIFCQEVGNFCKCKFEILHEKSLKTEKWKNKNKRHQDLHFLLKTLRKNYFS